MRVQERPDPEPGVGEVRVRVRAAGVNFADLLARVGLYPDAPKPPCVVGYEGAGVVDKLGPGATGVKEGQRALYLCRFWGHADTVVVPERTPSPFVVLPAPPMVRPKPDPVIVPVWLRVSVPASELMRAALPSVTRPA